MGINDRRAAERKRKVAEDEQYEENLIEAAKEYLDRGFLRASCLEQKTYCIMPPDGKWALINPNSMSQLAEFTDAKFERAVKHEMRERGMEYWRMTYSYQPQPEGVFNLLTKEHWVQADLNGEPHHYLFDIVTRCLGGNKQENIDHLEHCIAWKYWYPEDSWKLPCMVVHGQGNIGKGLMCGGILKVVFGGQTFCALKKNITGDFNGMVVGMAVVLIDEGAEGSSTEMKAMLQTPTLTINKKQINQFVAENTPWYWVSSNKPEGGVWLDRSSADRRYSVLHASKTLPYWICRHNGIEKPTAQDLGVARHWLRTEGENILLDPVEVAKWLSNLLMRHLDKGLPQELHGNDFERLMHLQEPLHEQMIRAIFTDPEFTHIERPFLSEAYGALAKETRCKNPVTRSRLLYEAVDHFLEENDMEHIKLDQKRQGSRTPFCWFDSTKPSHLAKTPNRDRYLDEMGKWIGPDLG